MSGRAKHFQRGYLSKHNFQTSNVSNGNWCFQTFSGGSNVHWGGSPLSPLSWLLLKIYLIFQNKCFYICHRKAIVSFGIWVTSEMSWIEAFCSTFKFVIPKSLIGAYSIQLFLLRLLVIPRHISFPTIPWLHPKMTQASVLSPSQVASARFQCFQAYPKR